MEKLELTANEIQMCMYDSVAYDFDSVSDYNTEGLTP